MTPYEEIVDNVSRVLKTEAFPRWLNTYVPNLHATPGEAILAGRTDDVLALSRSYLETSFT